jgi:SAM-dependent methyltransferase
MALIATYMRIAVPPRPEPFIAACLDQASPGAKLILEYGAGAVSYQASLHGRLVRTDLTAEPKDGLDRGLAAVCDLTWLPFRDGAFDLVFGVAVLVYLPNLDQALAECARVLKPGGRLLIFEYRRPVNVYNQLRGQGYAHTLGLGRLGRGLSRAGLAWRVRRDVYPDYGHRHPAWLARWRWLVVEAVKGG